MMEKSLPSLLSITRPQRIPTATMIANCRYMLALAGAKDWPYEQHSFTTLRSAVALKWMLVPLKFRKPKLR